MGTWGPGVFENDTAGDTRDALEDELSNGADVATAAERVLARFGSDTNSINGLERIEDKG